MYLVTVILRSNQHVLQFHFTEHKTAELQLNDKKDGGDLIIDDSFGSKGKIVRADISAIFLTDLDREMEASEIVDMARYRKDMKVQQKIQNPNPSILTPRRGTN